MNNKIYSLPQGALNFNKMCGA